MLKSVPWLLPGCEEIDAEGRTVIPGFNDSHQHLYNVGESLRMIKLHEVPSLAEMIERGRRFIEENHVAPGEIVLGRRLEPGLLHRYRPDAHP